MESLKKLVVISGAAAGIGAAIASKFASAGAHIFILDTNDSGLNVAKKITSQGFSAEFIKLDVSHWQETQNVIDKIAKAHGPITTCVANAGIARKVPFDKMSEENWDQLMNINLKGSAQLLRVAAMHMVRDGTGSLLAISSTSARLGWPEHIHYNASKAGIEGLIKGLAAELGPKGIRANALLPGVIRTAQSLSEEHSLGEEGLKEITSKIPLGKVGTPEEVADVALFLCSSGARYITGQSIVIDGGMTIASY